MTQYEYKIVDTGKHVEKQLNDLGEQCWRVLHLEGRKVPLFSLLHRG